MSDSVDFRHLEYLVAIHEGKNFTKAAEKLYRSQPAISQQIRALEEDIGFTIFLRGGRDGVTPTAAGDFLLGWAYDVLRERREILSMARAIHKGEVPPLRLGFSPFVTPPLLEALRDLYCDIFPACEIKLSSGDTTHILQRLDHGGLDCAILPMPLERDMRNVLKVAQSSLVLCMRADDPFASRTQIDIREAASRIKIFRDPELHPSAHSRLSELFAEVGIPLHLANSAATPTDMQWMVKQKYGLALIDQISTLEPGLVTRPIAGVNWTSDTAFVTGKGKGHMTLFLVEKYLKENGLIPKRKQPRSERKRPQQLKLIG